MSLYVSEQLLEDDLCAPASEKDNPEYIQGLLESLDFIKVAEHSNFICQIWVHNSGYMAVVGPMSMDSSKIGVKLSFAIYKDRENSFESTAFNQACDHSETKGIYFSVEPSGRKELGDMLFSKKIRQNDENLSAQNLILFLKGSEDLFDLVPLQDLNATGVYELLKTFFSDLDSSLLPYLKPTLSVSEVEGFQGIYDLFYDDENVANLLKAKAPDKAWMVNSHHGLWNGFVQNGGERWTLKEREEISSFSVQLNKWISENSMPPIKDQDLSAKVGGVALREWYVLESLNTTRLRDDDCLFSFLCEQMSANDWIEVMKKEKNWLLSPLHLSPTPWMILNRISPHEKALKSFLDLIKEHPLALTDWTWGNKHLNPEGALFLLLTSMCPYSNLAEKKQWLASPGALSNLPIGLVDVFQGLQERGVFNINNPIICNPKTMGRTFQSSDEKSLQKKMNYLVEKEVFDKQGVSKMASMLWNPSGYCLKDFKPLFEALDKYWAPFPLLSFTQSSLLKNTLVQDVKRSPVAPSPLKPQYRF